MTRNIKDTIYLKTQLWSNDSGRDYIKIGDEIFSINGLYCDAQGNQDRWGQHVKIIDIRWPVMVHRQYDGKLEYMGDAHDLCALDHWNYTWPSMGKTGYERVPWGEERTQVEPPAKPYYMYRGKLRLVVRTDEKHNWPHTMLELELVDAKGNKRYTLVAQKHQIVMAKEKL